MAAAKSMAISQRASAVDAKMAKWRNENQMAAKYGVIGNNQP